MSADASTPSKPSNPTSSNSTFALFVATVALLLAIGAILAVAFKMDHTHHGVSGSGTAMMAGNGFVPGTMMGGTGAAVSGEGQVEEVNLIVKSDEEKAKLGPEGTWHDAFLPANFSVQPGATVKVTVLNYDEGEHTFTSAPLGTNATIAAGSANRPATTTFTFRAPTKAGIYMWYCALPCDPWAMSHVGYMRGMVTVV